MKKVSIVAAKQSRNIWQQKLTIGLDLGEVEKCPDAQRLMTHPGVGALTALAFVLIIGEADWFHCGKQVVSYQQQPGAEH
jgi:Transposase IS116/IS110/IS902 family